MWLLNSLWLASAAAMGLVSTPGMALPSSMSADRAMPLARASNDTSSASSSEGVVKPSYDTTSCPGYQVAGDVKESSAGFTLPLKLAGPACNAYGVDVQELTLAVVYEKPHQLHVHIYDTAKQQYQLPSGLLFPRPDSDPENVNDGATKESSSLEFHHTAESGSANSSEPWAFWITRKGASDDVPPLFDTRPANIPKYDQPLNGTGSTNRNTTAMPNHNMVFENQYLQLSSALPRDANLYGLGERYPQGGIGGAGWRLNPDEMLQPFFTLDAGDPIESNMYGYHPVYLEVRNGTEENLLSHVVYHQNTAGLDVIMRPGVIQYRAIGGTLDFRFFSGNTEEQQVQQQVATVSDSSSSQASNATCSLCNSPQTAMEQYVQFVNLPVMVPDWSFGYHQLRWGYKTTQDLRDVHQAMLDNDIPLETMWSDIDWMKSYRNFVNDPDRYGDLADFVKMLHDSHQHYIPIIDAAIPAAPQNETDVYEPGTRGLELDVFLKNGNGTRYIGQVWPGYTYFVDQHHPNAEQWWSEAYASFSKTIGFDGIWNDMNEPSSFIVGSAGDPDHLSGGNQEHVTATSVDGWPEGYNNNTSGNTGNTTVDGKPSYTGKDKFYRKRAQGTPMRWAKRAERAEMQASLRARQGGDDPSQRPFNPADFHYAPANHSYDNVTQRFLWDPPYAIHNGINSMPSELVDNLNKKTVAMDTVSVAGKFYDVHNVDGSMMMKHTYEALEKIKPDQRPFIVGRSTYPGVGGYASHWLGDNYSKWQYLALSIPAMLQFQLFGVPTVGSDTCGFAGNTDEDLCNRWMTTSAFQPFFRNHNVEGALPQEPYRWDSVANASRIAIRKRYELLPEMYTARARSSQKGTPMAKSLWMEFSKPAVFETLRKVDSQYMLGSNLLVSPVLAPNASSVHAYFPDANGAWRNVFTYEALDVPANQNVSIAAPLSTINVHLRPGRAILSYTEARYTIFETRQQPYQLIVNLDNDGKASGNAYIDDGDSLLPTANKELAFTVADGKLSGSGKGTYQIENRLEQVLLLGIKQKPSALKAGDRDLLPSAHFDEARSMLNITGAATDLNGTWSIEWS